MEIDIPSKNMCAILDPDAPRQKKAKKVHFAEELESVKAATQDSQTTSTLSIPDLTCVSTWQCCILPGSHAVYIIHIII